MTPFFFDVVNSLVLLSVFILLIAPGIGIGFVIGEVCGKRYAIIFAVIYSLFIPGTLKLLLPHVPWLG